MYGEVLTVGHCKAYSTPKPPFLPWYLFSGLPDKNCKQKYSIINLLKSWKAITYFQKGNNDLICHVARAEMLPCVFSIKNISFFLLWLIACLRKIKHEAKKLNTSNLFCNCTRNHPESHTAAVLSSSPLYHHVCRNHGSYCQSHGNINLWILIDWKQNLLTYT